MSEAQWSDHPGTFKRTEFDNQKLDLMLNTFVSCYRQHPYFQINTHTHLFYLHAVRAFQVPQASLHQVGQEFVNRLMGDVFEVVVTKQQRPWN